MIAKGIEIKRETYLAVLMDREHGGPMIVASPMGGMDIESVAKDHPNEIFKVLKMAYFCSQISILYFYSFSMMSCEAFLIKLFYLY